MKIFGISDLHLSFSHPKPMAVFGEQWRDHSKKIETNWIHRVSPSDLVLIPGDISWALKYEDALPDLRFVARLPGIKVLIRGNHDFWWPPISRLRENAWRKMHFIQNDALLVNNVVLSGTRMWHYPYIRWGHQFHSTPASPGEPDDARIQRREFERLQLCLRSLENLDGDFRIFLTHFPPVDSELRPNPITGLLSKSGVHLCVFGHLHGATSHPVPPFDHVLDHVRYVLVSCDAVEFSPKLLIEV